MDEMVKLPKISLELKQTVKGFWYVGSLKINAESVGELDALISENAAKIRERVAGLNGEEAKQNNSLHGIKSEKERKEEIPLTPEEDKIFHNLKQLRMILAQQEGVPPYVVFHDATLKRIAREKPVAKEALPQIIGEKKSIKYGELVLELLDKHRIGNSNQDKLL